MAAALLSHNAVRDDETGDDDSDDDNEDNDDDVEERVRSESKSSVLRRAESDRVIEKIDLDPRPRMVEEDEREEDDEKDEDVDEKEGPQKRCTDWGW